MSRIKALALFVVLLGSAATFGTTPATATTRATAQAMCPQDYCFYHGMCVNSVECYRAKPRCSPSCLGG